MNKFLLSSLLVGSALLLVACTSASTPTTGSTPAPTSSSTSDTGDTGVANPNTVKVTLTADEVAKHNSASDCWFIIDGSVYNVTAFEDSHPGGKEAIVANCGKDASQAFHNRGDEGEDHSPRAKAMMASFLLGKLGETVQQKGS